MSVRPISLSEYSLLARELAILARQLDAQLAAEPDSHASAGSEPVADNQPQQCYPILGDIAVAFGLSSFERSILLAAAGLELDSEFARALSRAFGDDQGPALTFGLALARFADPHWSALAPSGPLRYWRLIRLGDGHGLVDRTIHIDEQVLHVIAGVAGWHPVLERVTREIDPPEHLAPSHRHVAETLAQLWSGSPGSVAMLCGRDARTRRDIAAAACASLGLRLSAMDLDALPARADERDELARLWDRDATLNRAVMFLDVPNTPNRESIGLSDRLTGLVVVGCDSPIRASHHGGHRPLVRIDVDPPTSQEQTELWRRALGADADRYGDAIARVVGHFRLGANDIHSASAALAASGNPTDPASALWQSCRTQSRPRLDGLAERITSPATWRDLVLPRANLTALRAIVAQVRQRDRVYQQWGYDRSGPRGLGVTALFFGPSGTGKTLAAEIVANELELDLYRIDLSGVVSKYIGETEKNLQQIFDAAESAGAVLLFDEADALFGKRSEVKDARDRHANIEVSYLLQRMESYCGLAILTTNMRAAIDDAFLRRIRFAVEFPFPDATQRAEIWRRSFPDTTPTEGLEPEQLAEIQLCGGNIRNVSLNAAFLAADAGQPVTMDHVLDAARAEFIKLERPYSGPARKSAKKPSTTALNRATGQPSNGVRA
ncbi:MAG: ATP-binding protein [Proteobacteria bacterium]|nr:ATP-binding protein [Pseudomonadota bacterium]